MTVIIGHGNECHAIKMNVSNTDLEILRVQDLETTQENVMDSAAKLMVTCTFTQSRAEITYY